jgi:alkaline phosphatase D
LEYDPIEPDSVYYYRFIYREVMSNSGRCRTLPAEDSDPHSIRFGVLNCQDYQNGYFGAMAQRAEIDVDFVLHLGDYIYEHVAEGIPECVDQQYADRRIDLPDSGTRPMSLDDFRHIYETYRTDPYLQRLHEQHTVIQTWDDHAIANDRYWNYDTDAPVFPDHPCGDVPEFTRYLTTVGIQAWWEFIPGRIEYNWDRACDRRCQFVVQ